MKTDGDAAYRPDSRSELAYLFVDHRRAIRIDRRRHTCSQSAERRHLAGNAFAHHLRGERGHFPLPLPVSAGLRTASRVNFPRCTCISAIGFTTSPRGVKVRFPPAPG